LIWSQPEPDLTLEEICLRLKSEEAAETGTTSVWRFYERQRHHIQKKLWHAAEQDRPDVAAARAELKVEQSSLMRRASSSSTRPAVRPRCPASRPLTPWRASCCECAGTATGRRWTLVAALRTQWPDGALRIDGAMDGPSFLAYVSRSSRRRCAKAIMSSWNNLRTHKIDGVRQAVERSAPRCAIYSLLAGPQSDSKWHSRAEDRAAQGCPRTVTTLMKLFASSSRHLHPSSGTNYFRHAG